MVDLNCTVLISALQVGQLCLLLSTLKVRFKQATQQVWRQLRATVLLGCSASKQIGQSVFSKYSVSSGSILHCMTWRLGFKAWIAWASARRNIWCARSKSCWRLRRTLALGSWAKRAASCCLWASLSSNNRSRRSCSARSLACLSRFRRCLACSIWRSRSSNASAIGSCSAGRT